MHPSNRLPNTRIFSMSFADLECSGGDERDVFELNGSTDTRYKLRHFDLSQHSEVAGASEEKLLIEVLTGAVTAAAGGATVAAVRLTNKGSSSLILGQVNATTVAGAASDETLRYASGWNINKPFVWRPPEDERIEAGLSERLSIRLSAPADALSLTGHLTFEEVGKIPSEN